MENILKRHVNNLACSFVLCVHLKERDQEMKQIEGWGFLSLIGCLVTVALSPTLLNGIWQGIGCAIGALFGVLSGKPYAASVNFLSK